MKFFFEGLEREMQKTIGRARIKTGKTALHVRTCDTCSGTRTVLAGETLDLGLCDPAGGGPLGCLSDNERVGMGSMEIFLYTK